MHGCYVAIQLNIVLSKTVIIFDDAIDVLMHAKKLTLAASIWN